MSLPEEKVRPVASKLLSVVVVVVTVAVAVVVQRR